jgi:ABC-2 type transport system permease protein
MRKSLVIARWEFFEKIKRKSFLISMIATPVILIGMVIASTLVLSSSPDSPTPIGILDATQKYQNRLFDEFDKLKTSGEKPDYILMNLYRPDKSLQQMIEYGNSEVRRNNIESFVVIYGSNNKLNIDFRSGKIGSNLDYKNIEIILKKVIEAEKLEKAGLTSEQIEDVLSGSPVKRILVKDENNGGSADFIQIFLTGYAFIMILLMMILFSGGMFVRSLVSEKSNKIIEILLSSCKPDELLFGKIIGLSWLGIFQLIVWAVLGLTLLGSHYISSAVFNNITLQIIYFLLGYLLFTSIFVGFGSIVSSEHEAQQVTALLSLVLVIPVLTAAQIINFPNSTLAMILSYFPLTSAPAMILRLNIYTPSVFEISSTMLISLLSIYFVIYLSAKFFRIGILSYGKRPSLKELFAWIKE